MSAVRVVGIDLSLASTGVAAVSADEDGGMWRTWQVASPKAGDGVAAQAHRLKSATYRILDAVMSDPLTSLVVIEDLPPGTQQRGIRDVAGQWWMVVSELVRLGFLVATVMPSTLKVYAVGRGGSPKAPVRKAEILAAAQKAYPAALTGGVHDVADALFLAGMGARRLGFPVDCLPDVNLAAMAKAKWPNRIGD